MGRTTPLACSLLVIIAVLAIWVSHVRAASATLTFAITRIVELQCNEGPGESCPNDYYPKVDVGAQGLDDGKDRFCCAHGTDFPISDWIFRRTVDVTNNVPIHVELWDQDDLSPDDQIDIANGPSSLDLTVDLNNCTWRGGGLHGVLNAQASSQGSGDDSSKIYFMITTDAPGCTDSDGDGLLDNWETNGYDDDGDGIIDVDLPAMGADPKRKDLFLEIDYINAANHTHAPVSAAVQQVVQAFANAPVGNLDGTTGIQLHVDVGSLYGAAVVTKVKGTGGVTGTFGDYGGGGEQIPETGNTIVDWDGATGNPGTNFFSLKSMNANRINIFRYGMFVHQTNLRNAVNDCTSGWSKGIPGANFIVSLGGVRGAPRANGSTNCWGTDAAGNSVGATTEQAGTLMHEFGHTIGLQHGGTDGVNNKPNYLSVMNYSFQACQVPSQPVLSGIPVAIPGACDYSRFQMPASSGLNENSLDECQGIDNGAFNFGAFDWDGDKVLTGVTCTAPNTANVLANINGDFNDANNNGTQDSGEAPIISTLNGAQDWGAIVYNFRTIFDFATAGEPSPDEPDSDVIDSSRAYLAALVQPTFVVDKTGPPDVRVGDTISYNVTVKNSGRGPALNVTFTDTKPNATTQVVNIGTVTVGSSIDRAISYPVACSIADGTVLVNSVTANGIDLLTNPFSSSDSVKTTVHAPILTLSTSATPSVNAGEAITYTITYQNVGTAGATNVTITDVIPAGVYYSGALDAGAGPTPTSVTVNSDGSRTLVWQVGTVAGGSGPHAISFIARPTLLALGGATFTNDATLAYGNGTGCVFDPLKASASTAIAVVPASLDPLSQGYWKNHPEVETAELLARIQATDQRFDRPSPDGRLSLAEAAAMFGSGGGRPYILDEQLLALYFNLASRRINAGSPISSRLAATLSLSNVRDAALYAISTLALPVTQAMQYSNATTVLDEINTRKSIP